MTIETMKRTLTSLAALMMVVPALPVEANNYVQSGGTRQETCYTTVYREEYVPGTRGNPGTVRSWTEREETLCDPEGPHSPQPYNPRPQSSSVDDNSCIEGAVLGGLAGGALGAGLSRDEGNFIGIPLGIVGGAIVGCQIDGG